MVGGALTRRAVLGPEDVATLGDTEFNVTVHLRADAADQNIQGVGFNRSPRVQVMYEGERLTAPEPPERPVTGRFPWITLLAPLAVAVILFAVTRNPLSILFAALGPVMIAGQFFETTISGKRAFRAATVAFRADLEELRGRLAIAAEEERARRSAEHPPVAAAMESVRRLAPGLWSRRPDRRERLTLRGWAALPVRLGSVDSVQQTPPGRSTEA